MVTYLVTRAFTWARFLDLLYFFNGSPANKVILYDSIKFTDIKIRNNFSLKKLWNFPDLFIFFISRLRNRLYSIIWTSSRLYRMWYQNESLVHLFSYFETNARKNNNRNFPANRIFTTALGACRRALFTKGCDSVLTFGANFIIGFKICHLISIIVASVCKFRGSTFNSLYLLINRWLRFMGKRMKIK